MKPTLLLPNPLGDAVNAIHRLEPCWNRFVVRTPRGPLMRRILAWLGIHTSDGRADISLSLNEGPCTLSSVDDIISGLGGNHAWTRPELGHGAVLCPNASTPEKEWPWWHLLDGMGRFVGSWHPDPLGAIVSAQTVVANHSGLAHLGALLGRRVICLQNAWHPVDPIGSTVIGSAAAGWPSPQEVSSAIADGSYCLSQTALSTR